MEEKQLCSAEGVFSYQLVQSKRKSLQIQVTQQGELVVKAPVQMHEKEIEGFLLKKAAWIRKHMQDASVRREQLPHHTYESGDIFWYRGQPVTLALRNTRQLNRAFVNYIDGILYLTISEEAKTEQKKQVIEQWYRREAKKVLKDRVDYYQKVLNVSSGQIRIKDQKSRWGSCSAQGNLNFNWRLVMAPDIISDYVVVHELCHLHYMNHSAEFWSLVQAVLPDYRQRRNWLKNNGAMLA